MQTFFEKYKVTNFLGARDYSSQGPGISLGGSLPFLIIYHFDFQIMHLLCRYSACFHSTEDLRTCLTFTQQSANIITQLHSRIIWLGPVFNLHYH